MKLFLIGILVVFLASCSTTKDCCKKTEKEKTCHKVEKDTSCHK